MRWHFFNASHYVRLFSISTLIYDRLSNNVGFHMQHVLTLRKHPVFLASMLHSYAASPAKVEAGLRLDANGGVTLPLRWDGEVPI